MVATGILRADCLRTLYHGQLLLILAFKAKFGVPLTEHRAVFPARRGGSLSCGCHMQGVWTVMLSRCHCHPRTIIAPIIGSVL